MMASMSQPFPAHPGMAGHAGVAHGGQPMVHGHPSSQGVPGGQQPGVSLGPQMHPGITGPGGPQVSQAGPMMAGMMQGAGPPGVSGGGPSAHALSHLNPHQFTPQHQHMQQVCKFQISFLRQAHISLSCPDGFQITLQMFPSVAMFLWLARNFRSNFATAVPYTSI